MASRPSRAVGHKKLATYGSSSRKKHLNLATKQNPDAPRPSQSPAARHVTGPSPEAPEAKRAQSNSERTPTDSKENSGGQQSGRKRKRDHSATHAAKSVPNHRETLDNKPDATNNASSGALKIPGKAMPGANHEPSPLARSRSSPKDGLNAPARDTPCRGLLTASGRNTPPASRRPRLIDALAAQRDAEMIRTHEQSGDETGSALPRRTTSGQDLRSRAADRRGVTPTSRKIKLTYSQPRGVLGESRAIDDTDPPGPDAENDAGFTGTQALSSPAQDTLADGTAEDDDMFQPAIKSVHELRRSGANNRFADEMDDLLTRIGTPGAGSLTMRRNALCELAQSLPRASFARQFRDHVSRDKVARGIDLEEDVISGFALAAALVIFFMSGPAPHLVRQLSDEGLCQLLGRMLRVSEDIDFVATQRATNLPRTTKASVHNVKSILMRMPIWRGLELNRLSPRSLGLQLLETVARCADEQLLEHMAVDLIKDLVSVAANSAEAGATSNTVDYVFAVFALEVLSSAGVTTGSDRQGPSMAQLPRSIAMFLRNAMQRWPCDRGELEAATLKLAINTTNTERGAAAFADADLLSLLADRIGRGYGMVQSAIGSGPLEGDLYDELVLLLGVMINIVEHSQPARMSVRGKALDELVTLWRGNRQTVSEVRRMSCPAPPRCLHL